MPGPNSSSGSNLDAAMRAFPQAMVVNMRPRRMLWGRILSRTMVDAAGGRKALKVEVDHDGERLGFLIERFELIQDLGIVSVGMVVCYEVEMRLDGEWVALRRAPAPLLTGHNDAVRAGVSECGAVMALARAQARVALISAKSMAEAALACIRDPGCLARAVAAMAAAEISYKAYMETLQRNLGEQNERERLNNALRDMMQVYRIAMGCRCVDAVCRKKSMILFDELTQARKTLQLSREEFDGQPRRDDVSFKQSRTVGALQSIMRRAPGPLGMRMRNEMALTTALAALQTVRSISQALGPAAVGSLAARLAAPLQEALNQSSRLSARNPDGAAPVINELLESCRTALQDAWDRLPAGHPAAAPLAAAIGNVQQAASWVDVKGEIQILKTNPGIAKVVDVTQRALDAGLEIQRAWVDDATGSLKVALQGGAFLEVGRDGQFHANDIAREAMQNGFRTVGENRIGVHDAVDRMREQLAKYRVGAPRGPPVDEPDEDSSPRPY